MVLESAWNHEERVSSETDWLPARFYARLVLLCILELML